MIQGFELVPDLIFKAFHGMGFLLHQIPFIDDQDKPFTLFDYIIYNGFILLAKPFFRINQNQDHI